MKRTQIVATLAFAFVLGAAVPIVECLTTSSVAATTQEAKSAKDPNGNSTLPADHSIETTQAEDANLLTDDQPDEDIADAEVLQGAVQVSTLEDLTAALNAPAVTSITLEANITTTSVIIVARDSLAATLELNLNQHSLTNSTASGYVLLVKQGNLSITGEGTIEGQNGLEIQGARENTPNFATLTVGPQVTVKGKIYGIGVTDYAGKEGMSYGAKLVFNGRIEAGYGISTNGRITNTEGRPEIIIGDNAVIATSAYSDSTPIYAAGNATWKIGAATLIGKSGFNIRAGRLDLTGTSLTVDGEMRDPRPSSGGIDGIGVAFQIEHHEKYADGIVLNINSGTYTTQNGDVFYEYGTISDQARAVTQLADINIKGGTFRAGDGRQIFGGTVEQNDVEISGGTFKGADVATEDFAKLLVEGFKISSNGTVIADRPASSGRPNSSTTSPETPEDPSDPQEPSDPTPEQKPSTDQNTAPDTGLNHGRGALTAASTVIPMLCGAIGVIFMVCTQKVFARRKALNEAEVEMEIDQQIAEIAEEPEEPVIERFVAEAIERDEPEVTPVDTFILQK